jgi:outer membrane protein OmpA-like peptidoglycan-associated protein
MNRAVGDHDNDLRLGAFVDRDTFQFVRDYDHPPALVWAALTDAAQLTTWFWPCSLFEAEPGGRFTFDDDEKVWRGRISEFEPPRLLAFAGMRFELSERDGGCQLVVSLSKPRDGWSPMALAGYHGWLGRLDRLVDGVSADAAEDWASDIWDSRFIHCEREVRRKIAGGAKVIHRIHFEANDPTLTAEAQGLLNELVAVLRARGDLAVTIDGFGDDPCSLEQSLDLCGRRVAVAKQHLCDAGIGEARISIGFVLGNYHYLMPRDAEAGRAFNRRVELRPTY